MESDPDQENVKKMPTFDKGECLVGQKSPYYTSPSRVVIHKRGHRPNWSWRLKCIVFTCRVVAYPINFFNFTSYFFNRIKINLNNHFSSPIKPLKNT